MVKKLRILFLFFAVLAFNYANAQLSVTGGISNATLANNLFGPGVTISNLVVNCGGAGQYGTFSATASTNLGLTNGILLTTGSIGNAVGPNNSASATTNIGSTANDACVNSITGGSQFDPCIINFDIVPSCDTFNVSYVFGSEEYNEFVNAGFNDAFGFFINGPKPGGGTYSCYNVARIPGTATPVTIDNVNNGSNSGYYRDNTSSSSPSYTSIQYDGLTVPLVAVIPVVACSSYHMELAVVDIGDGNYDSGVFLEYQGLRCVSDQTIAVTPKNTTICPGNPVILTASGMATYTWSPAAGLNVTTGAVVTATPTVTTKYIVTGTNSCTSEKDTVTITVSGGPVISVTPAAPTICTGGSVNLTASGSTGTYNWSPGTGLNVTTGPTVTANPAATTTYTVSSTVGGCTGMKTVVVTVTTTPTVSVLPSPAAICVGGNIGLTASGAASYTWSPSTGLNVTTGANVNASPGSTQTYTVTGAVGSCPAAPVTVVLTVNPTPILSIAPTAPTICPGGNVNLIANGGGAGATYTWSPNTNLSATTGVTVNASPGSTTTYTMNGTSLAGCPGAPQTVVVTVAASLNLSVNPTNPIICIGDSIVLSASGAATYTWRPGTGLSCTNCPNPTAQPGSTTTYTLVGASGTCSDSINVVLTVNPPLPVSITVNGITSAICPGDSLSMTANGATSYTWSPTTGLNCTTCATVDAGPATTTTYTVTGSNVAGCVSTATQIITVYPKPSVTISPANTTICQGDTVSLSASGLSTYNWAPDSELNVTTGPVVVATPTTTVTYTVSGKGVGGCTAKDSITVAVNPKPVVLVTSSSPTACAGGSISLTASGATTYSWAPSSGLTLTTGDTTTANPLTTTTYTVVGYGPSGCTDTVTTVVKINQPPTIKVTASSATICSGDSMTLIASGASTYAWSPPAGLNTTTGNTVIAFPAGTSSFIVTGTDTNGCKHNDTVSVTVSNITIRGNAVKPSICTGDSTVITASGATSYTWSPSIWLSATTGSNVITTPLATITYTIVGTQGAHCIDSTTVVITVNPVPVISVKATDSSICSGGGITTLTASGANTYKWSPATGLNKTTGSTVTAKPPGTVTYTVTGSNASGCSDTASIVITVLPTPTINITAAGGDSLCPGQSKTLTAGGAVTYMWSTGSTSTSINVSPGTNTTYTVVGISAGCSDTAMVSIIVYNLKVAMSNDSVCIGKTVLLNASASGGEQPYSYVWNNALGSGPGPKAVTVANTGYYVCTVTDACGTVVADSSLVTAVPSPSAAFVASPNSILGGEYVSFVNANSGATTWYWTFGEGGSSDSAFPYYQYDIPGTYIVTLVVSNQFGCADTSQDTVLVTEGIYVPNVFTPNNDGVNDVFHVTAGGLKTYNITIFNRWGEKVFEANSPNIDWTGNSQAGVEESDGTYYYILKATDYKNKDYNLDGYLQLIR